MPNLFLLYFHVCMHVCVCAKVSGFYKEEKRKRKAVVEIILLKYF